MIIINSSEANHKHTYALAYHCLLFCKTFDTINQLYFQLFGDKPKLEYFGPSDFVPQHPYALPMKQHGPMKLTYMSAKDFPNIPKYGLIPIPR